MDEDDILKLIFTEGLSTKEQVSDLSGRGMGLSAVKKEVEKLGGKINMQSILNQGTQFCFILPYEDS